MELSYWESRWRKGNIGFHLSEVYPGLVNNLTQINLPDKFTCLVPLCGKSLDMVWLSSLAGKVIGVEISEKAVKSFFLENGLPVQEQSYSGFKIFRSGNIEIWCGDFMKLPLQKIPEIDLIYDKAALVALPSNMRKKYIAKIHSLSNPHTHILLHYFTYNQNEIQGPPFSISQEEIKKGFEPPFNTRILDEKIMSDEFIQKFKKRGLKTHFIEYLLLLSQ